MNLYFRQKIETLVLIRRSQIFLLRIIEIKTISILIKETSKITIKISSTIIKSKEEDSHYTKEMQFINCKIMLMLRIKI